MPEIGQTISHYMILERIGGGGMGVVYKAEDIRLGRRVALKFLSEEMSCDNQLIERFQREARSASALNHPNICTIYEIDEHEGQHFIAMEYLKGQTLSQLILYRSLQMDEILDLAIQITDGLDAAHSEGIIHRDLKPANIFLTNRGHAKILDFGVAKLLPERSKYTGISSEATAEDTVTIPGTVVGTAAYMSPEQTLGKNLDARSDLFSFGAVLYEMAVGREAFSGPTLPGVYDAVLHTTPPPMTHINPNFPVQLERIVSKSLEKKPDLRYQTASDLRSDLMRLKADSDSQRIAAYYGHSTTKQTHPLSRRKWVLPVAALFLLASLAFLGIQTHRILGGSSPIRSIAVLPFENRIGDENTEYICDIVTKNLIDSLSNVPESLRIPSWIVVSKYKETKIDLKKIRQELRVDALLTGQISQRNDELIIESQITDTRDESHILSFGPYTLESRDILITVQDCAEEITESLQLRLSGKEKNNLEAHKLYQRGKYYWDKRTTDGFEKAIDSFDRVIAMGSNRFIARAHAGLANCYNLLGIYGGASQADSYQKARNEATLALELDEGLAEAHTALGLVYWHYDHNWREAQSEFNRAIALDPNYETAHQWYAEYLTAIGRFDEAENEMRQAQNIDPESLIIRATLGWLLYSAGRSDEAIEQLEMTLRLDPDYPAAHWFLGYAYALKHQYEQSIASLKRAIDLSPDNLRIMADIAHVYAISGQRAEALKILSDLNSRSESESSISQFSYAVIYAGLGEKEKAFEALNSAIVDRPWDLVHLKVDHMLDPLHSDPRFKQVVADLGIPSN